MTDKQRKKLIDRAIAIYRKAYDRAAFANELMRSAGVRMCGRPYSSGIDDHFTLHVYTGIETLAEVVGSEAVEDDDRMIVNYDGAELFTLRGIK